MKIKQSVINTFDRVGIDKTLDNTSKAYEVKNWFTHESFITTQLIAACVYFVYNTTLAYERDIYTVNVSDFDRIRYFILEQDKDVYMGCID